MTPAEKREKNDVALALSELYQYFLQKPYEESVRRQIQEVFLFLNRL